MCMNGLLVIIAFGPLFGLWPSSFFVLCAFLFLHFSKKKLQKYIFGFRFYRSIPLPPDRGRQGAYRPAGGR